MKSKVLVFILCAIVSACIPSDRTEIADHTTILNPYGYAPLTAIVSFDQWRPSKKISARVSIAGQTGEEAALTYTVPLGSTTPKTEVPVIGLFADYVNQVDITFHDPSGKQLKKLSLEIQTDEIPFAFAELPLVKGTLPPDEWIFATAYSFEIKKGEDMVFIQKTIALDGEGRIRWFGDFKGRSHVVTEVIDGYLFAGSNKGTFAGKMVKYDFMGRELEVHDISKGGKYYNIHHDIRKTEEGTFFLTVNERDRSSVENIVLEYDPRLLGNNVQLELDLEEFLPNMDDYFTDLPFSYYAGKKDPLHINGIYPYPDGEHLLVSSRNAGLAKIHTSSYQMKWIFFPHALKAAAAKHVSAEERGSREYLEKRFQLYKSDKGIYQRTPANGMIPYQDYSDLTFNYEAFLLLPVDQKGEVIRDEGVIVYGDTSQEFSYPYRQHAPVFLKNGNIAMFDNGDRDKPGKNISRAVEYRILEDEDGYGGKVMQVWEYISPQKDFAPYVGDIRELNSGNRLVCFGSIHFENVPKPSKNTEALIVEVQPTLPADEVYSLRLALPPGSVLYRADKIEVSELVIQ